MRRAFVVLAAGWAALLAFSLAARLRDLPSEVASVRMSAAERATVESGDARWHRVVLGLKAATGGRPGVLFVSGGNGEEEFLTYRAAYELYPMPVWVLGTGATLPPATGRISLDPQTAAWIDQHGAQWIVRWRDRDPDHPELSRIVARSETGCEVRRAPWPVSAASEPSPVVWRWLAGLALLVLAGAAAVRRATAGPHPTWSTWDRAGATLVVLGFFLALTQAFAPQSAWNTWDAWMVWDLKVKAIRHAGWLPISYWNDPGYRFSRQEVPLAWPWLQAALAACAGTMDTRLLRLASPVFCLAMAPLLAALAGELGVARGRWLVAGLVSVLPLALEHAANGYVDWPLATVTTGALVVFLRVRRGAARGWEAGAWAGAAGLLKQEGIVAGAACVAVLAWSIRRQRAGRREALRAAGTWLALIGPWLVIRTWYHLHSEAYGPLSFALMGQAPGRLAMVLRAVVLETLGSGRVTTRWGEHLLGSWLLFWYVALPALALGWKRLVQPGRREVAIVVAVQLVTMTVAYLTTNWNPAALIGTSLDRLLLQTVPDIAVLAAVAGPFAPLITVRPMRGFR